MSSQSEFADQIERRLEHGPVAVSDLVSEIRARWGPSQTTGSVHMFVCEAIYCLPWEDLRLRLAIGGSDNAALPAEPEEAYFILAEELENMETDFADASRFVLVRASNDISQSTSG